MIGTSTRIATHFPKSPPSSPPALSAWVHPLTISSGTTPTGGFTNRNRDEPMHPGQKSASSTIAGAGARGRLPPMMEAGNTVYAPNLRDRSLPTCARSSESRTSTSWLEWRFGWTADGTTGTRRGRSTSTAKESPARGTRSKRLTSTDIRLDSSWIGIDSRKETTYSVSKSRRRRESRTGFSATRDPRTSTRSVARGARRLGFALKKPTNCCSTFNNWNVFGAGNALP